MPPQPFIDVETIDFSSPVADHAAIYDVLPHRYEFERIDEIVHVDEATNIMVGYHDLRQDEFWVRGHIPGRPLFPGVMMIETAAQLVSWYAMTRAEHVDKFLGFGAVEGVKFRGEVKPGQRLVMMGRMIELRPPRRCKGAVQGFVEGQMVFEGTITGMWL